MRSMLLKFAFIFLLSSTASALQTPIETDSLVKCTQGSNLAMAVYNINRAIAQPAVVEKIGVDGVRIANFTSSAPVINKQDDGSIVVCVTLTRKQ